MGLADSLDAMFSDRPHRRTRSYPEVMVEVSSCAGTQFDPAVMEALFGVAEQEGRSFFRNSATTVGRPLAGAGRSGEAGIGLS